MRDCLQFKTQKVVTSQMSAGDGGGGGQTVFDVFFSFSLCDAEER